MATSPIDAFWSYAHRDDAGSRGRVLCLLEHLRAELDLLSTEPPEIFSDRTSLEWGDRWRHVIDIGLDEAALLIAIITPNYFTRKECRAELLTFLAKEGRDGERRLLLPILFAPVSTYTAENPDQLIATVSERQYEDWSVLRLVGDDSAEYREAVNRAARRILALTESIKVARLERESRLQSEDPKPAEQDHEELGDLLVKADELWPGWLEAVQVDEIDAASFRAEMDAYAARRERLRKANRPQSQALATYRQQGAAALPKVHQRLSHAQTYSKATLELDPIIRSAVTTAANRPALVGLLVELREKIDDAVRVILENEEFAERGMLSSSEFIAQIPYVDANWKCAAAEGAEADALIDEANAIVMRWAADIQEAVRLASESRGRDAATGGR
ncbi:MAG: toll/interleukin-1 receptor domain-containing protein [Actinobacteria bacterium]|nr:toll/interleukin-1 receptor domain-containing protein [Actinomycetota bacterium]MCG2802140.1 toll/interleukin-1 receptor domain-containing protein [Cellulomonas sp.]